MHEAPSPILKPPKKLAAVLKSLPAFTSTGVIVLGLAVLLGWALDISLLRSVVSTWVPTAPDTAIAFVLLGAALLAYRLRPFNMWLGRLSLLAIWLVLLMALLTLGEYLFGWKPGLDQVLFPDAMARLATAYPGRMALITMVDFILLASALLLFRARTRWLSRPALGLASLAVLLGWMVLLIYIYDSSNLNITASYTQMALPTMVAFVVLGIGVLLASPDSQAIEFICGDNMGSVMVRRLLPAVIFIPILVEWLLFLGARVGLYRTVDGLAFWVMLGIAGLILLIWGSARSLNQMDAGRQRVEAALRESEARYRRIVETAQEGIWLLDTDHTTTFGNTKMAEMLGYPVESLLGKSPFDFVDDADRALLQQHLASQRQGITEQFELGLRHHDGTTLLTMLKVSPGLDETGKYAGSMVMIADVTEHKRAEKALRESEIKFRKFVEQSFEGIVLTDEQGLIAEWNPHMEQLTGLRRASVLGQPLGDVQYRLAPQPRRTDITPAQVQEMLLDFLQTGQPSWTLHIREDEIQHIDGSLLTVQVAIFPIQTNNGFIGASVLRDITAQKRTEQALAQEHNLLLTLINTLPDYVFIKDTQQRFVVSNLAHAQSVSKTPEELIGKTSADLYAPDLAQQYQADDRLVLQSGQPLINIERTSTDSEGNRRAVLSNKVPLRDQSGQVVGLVGISRDITERKLAEKALQDAHGLLEQRVIERTQELSHAKERVEAILSNSPDGILLLSSELRIQQANAAFNRLFACEASDCFGGSLLAVVQPEDADRLTKTIQAVKAQQQSKRLEVRAGRQDGTVFDAELSLGSIKSGGLVCTIRDITERVQAQASLRENEARFRNFFEQPLIGMAITSPTKDVMMANDTFCDLLGYRREELFQKTWSEMTHPDDLAADVAQFNQVIAGAMDGYSLDKRFIRKDGQVLHTIMTCRCLRDDEGKVKYFYALIQDITARKQMEQLLRYHASLQENVTDAVIATDLEFRIQSWNPAAERIYGWTAEEVMGRPVGEIVQTTYPSPQAQQQVLNEFRECGYWTGEVIQYHKNGHAIHVLNSIVLFKDEKGLPFGVVTVNHDVTERKQAENALREQHDFLQQVINNVPGLIMVKDRAGCFQLVNYHVAEINGTSPADMLGKTDADFNPNQAEVAFFLQKDREALETGQPSFIPEETVFGRYYQTSKIPLKNRQGEYDRLLVVASDITERKKAEFALRHALEKEKELVAVKSRFITTASHDFRTPLTVILSSTELLEMQIKRQFAEATAMTLQKPLSRIGDSVRRMTDLLNDVLAVTQGDVGKVQLNPKLLDLESFSQNLLQEIQLTAGPQHVLTISFAGSNTPIEADPQLLRQILVNLLSNAVKYSPRGGSIALAVQHSLDKVVFQVSDEGIGIPKPDQAHLFESFHRAGNVDNIQGTGLGMAIVKRAVDALSGTIVFDSHVSVGTTFTVTLPTKLASL